MSKNNRIEWLSTSTIVSPLGTARYSYLREPDTKFEPCYRITLELDDNQETEDFLDTLLDIQNKFMTSKGEGESSKLKCVKTSDDGAKSIQFKSSATLASGQPRPPIKIYDASNQQVVEEPWGGDRIRVSFKPGGWESGFGIGVKLYMSAVQVIEKEAGSGGSSPFDQVEGGFVGTNTVDASATATKKADTVATEIDEDVPSIDDSDIPF